MAKRDMPAKNDVRRHIPLPVEEEKYVEPEPELVEEPIKLVVDNCNELNVRSGPNKKAAIMAVIKKGTVVIVKDMIDDWLSVNVPSLKINGYILGQYTREAD